jgi:hypothetical protein
MFRVPQHEQKNVNDINSSPFVLSAVEGRLKGFSATCQTKAQRRRELIAKAFWLVALILKNEITMNRRYLDSLLPPWY